MFIKVRNLCVGMNSVMNARLLKEGLSINNIVNAWKCILYLTNFMPTSVCRIFPALRKYLKIISKTLI